MEQQSLKSLTDEALVELYRNGEDEAFSELYERYSKILNASARKSGERYPSVGAADFLGRLEDRFMEAVKKYQPDKGASFSTYCYLKLKKVEYDAVKNLTRKNKTGAAKINQILNVNEMKHDVEILFGAANSDGFLRTGAAFGIGQGMQEDEVELFQTLKEQDERDAEVVRLIVAGYQYHDIAAMMGKDGTKNEQKNWTYNVVRRVRKKAIEYYAKSQSTDQLLAYLQTKGADIRLDRK